MLSKEPCQRVCCEAVMPRKHKTVKRNETQSQYCLNYADMKMCSSLTLSKIFYQYRRTRVWDESVGTALQSSLRKELAINFRFSIFVLYVRLKAHFECFTLQRGTQTCGKCYTCLLWRMYKKQSKAGRQRIALQAGYSVNYMNLIKGSYSIFLEKKPFKNFIHCICLYRAENIVINSHIIKQVKHLSRKQFI